MFFFFSMVFYQYTFLYTWIFYFILFSNFCFFIFCFFFVPNSKLKRDRSGKQRKQEIATGQKKCRNYLCSGTEKEIEKKEKKLSPGTTPDGIGKIIELFEEHRRITLGLVHAYHRDVKGTEAGSYGQRNAFIRLIGGLHRGR